MTRIIKITLLKKKDSVNDIVIVPKEVIWDWSCAPISNAFQESQLNKKCVHGDWEFIIKKVLKYVL